MVPVPRPALKPLSSPPRRQGRALRKQFLQMGISLYCTTSIIFNSNVFHPIGVGKAELLVISAVRPESERK
jgi:hypothetical protein